MTTTSSLGAEELTSAAQRERRRRILDATTQLASQGGFDAVQMRAVAERADVALGTLYRYFPSKIHLLVCALADLIEETSAQLRGRPVPGGTPAARVGAVLGRATQVMQQDPHLTEALTRAFMFADASVADEIRTVGVRLTGILTRALAGTDLAEDVQPDPHDVAVARVVSDVWLASMVAWVTGRMSADEVADHLETAVDLVLP